MEPLSRLAFFLHFFRYLRIYVVWVIRDAQACASCNCCCISNMPPRARTHAPKSSAQCQGNCHQAATAARARDGSQSIATGSATFPSPSHVLIELNAHSRQDLAVACPSERAREMQPASFSRKPTPQDVDWMDGAAAAGGGEGERGTMGRRGGGATTARYCVAVVIRAKESRLRGWWTMDQVPVNDRIQNADVTAENRLVLSDVVILGALRPLRALTAFHFKINQFLVL
jgi:hypothetical protein